MKKLIRSFVFWLLDLESAQTISCGVFGNVVENHFVRVKTVPKK